jgi:hypothetical protein
MSCAVGAAKSLQQVAAVDRNCGVPWRTYLVEQGLHYMLEAYWIEGLHNSPVCALSKSLVIVTGLRITWI